MNAYTANGRAYGEWFKSSYSSEGGGQCLETCPAPEAVHVRDSKQNVECGPTLTFTSAAFAAFIEYAKA
ncbi:DUF397 domain-containing protein [Streptomyces xanthochromogenes]|uniref:DUF397 domain-containing protein n=1 Tax=Streptomyces xanthochromogenes TaxID=67384 RepID=UPI00378AE0F3